MARRGSGSSSRSASDAAKAAPAATRWAASAARGSIGPSNLGRAPAGGPAGRAEGHHDGAAEQGERPRSGARSSGSWSPR